MRFISKIPFSLSIIAALFLPTATRAGILPACAATGACQVCDIVNVFVTLGKWLMVSAGGLALLVIVWASFGFVSSAGNAEKVAAAKKQITGAILGMGITLVAFQMVSILIAILAIPSTNQGFAGQQSQDTGKFASLSNFLGIPWWEICSVKGLRTAGAKYEKDLLYRGTDVCRYWGDGTPCQKLSAEKEKELAACGELEGSADLTDEQKKALGDCKDKNKDILRCCSGVCTKDECKTKEIVKSVTSASSAYNLTENLQTTLSGSTICRKDIDSTKNTTCGRSTPTDETRVRANLQDPKKDYAVAINNASCPPLTCFQDFKADNPGKSCTTVGGLNDYVTATLLAANNYCKTITHRKCITITGGNECGHASHGPSNVVDIDYSWAALGALQKQNIKKSCPKPFQKGYTCEPVNNHNCAAQTTGCPSGTQWLHVEF